MLTVEPSGSTKLETELLTPSFSSAHSIDTGSVADDEDVENAMSCAGRMAAMKRPKGSFALKTTSPP